MLARTSKIRKPNLACIVTLACVLLLGACTAKVQRTHTPRPGNKYATGFQITDTLGMKCVRVFAPWKTDSVMATYYVSEPLERLGASSATHIGMLAELGLLDKLAGMCNPEVSYHELPATCQHLGDAMQPDCERIIANGVQAMLYSTYSPSDQSAERMESVGIPVLYNNEWRESTPLARAEWIRFVAVFFDKLDLADSIFADVERKYNALKDQQAALDSRQSASIVSGLDFRGTWYVPAGGTYMGALFKDAGANYAFADDPRETSIPLTFEQALRSRGFLQDGHLTNAGVLLFSENPTRFIPWARVRVIRFDGNKMETGRRLNIVKDRTFDGPLPKQIEGAKGFISSQLR